MRTRLDAIYTLKSDVLLAAFDTAGILFDLGSRRCLELNRTGMEVIAQLDGRRSLEHIISQLAVVYGLTAEHLQKDLEGFIEDLHERNLLDVRQTPKDTSQG